MIVYSDTKRQFVEDVKHGDIASKILSLIRAKGLNAGQEREFDSWHNSMQFMRNIVDDNEMSDDIQIAIEYNIPQTSKRVDFIIIGADVDNHDNIVIIELKQWSKAEVVDNDMHYSVRTYVANDNRIVCHPSYQAYSYSKFISNYSEIIQDKEIGIVPCAYLHNYKPEYKSELSAEIYKEWYTAAPFFIRDEAQLFSQFIKKYVTKKSSSGNLLYMIDGGRIRPSKSLQDSLTDMVKGNPVFDLLDEQAVCYDMCIKTMLQCQKDKKKRTIIIQGGPGTGKSVLAVNLLMALINRACNTAYVTKNSAPRQAFLSLLTSNHANRLVDIEHLFRSPFGLSTTPENGYDCLIIDEAHRLVKKMYGDWNGDNQVKECIKASLLSVFMIDEDQSVTTKDIGSIEEIKYWCDQLQSRVIINDNTKLVSQFRCNGSDAYIQFIDNILHRNKEVAPVAISELNYEFRVFDSPVAMREALRQKNAINNKARMVAGYCYDWNVKNRRGEYDIELPDGFRAQWNLANDKIWAINPTSFEQVGCIHTAQGLEFDYVGVLIGNDLSFDKESMSIITNKAMISRDDNSSGIRTASDDIARRLILNTYKTLLTRGQKGCFVYCEDKNLADYIKSFLPNQDERPQTPPIKMVVADNFKFINFLPVYSLKAACGYFGDGEQVEESGWMQVDGFGRLNRNMFVVQAYGDSMEPRIHNGDWCIFRANPAGSREGKILLVQNHTDYDPAYGGSYAIKQYTSKKSFNQDGTWQHSSITLLPLNNAYSPIQLEESEADNFRVIGEFLGTIKQSD